MNSIRVRFTRGEEVKFISHLDLMKVFERAIRRSGLPIAYSKGFNPHPHMVFGLPMAVGMTSECEYADFELDRKIGPEEFMERLNASMPNGIRVTAAVENNSKKNIMASISGADYMIYVFLNEPLSIDKATAGLNEMLAGDSIKVEKETRRKDKKIVLKETEIRPLILEASIETVKTPPPGYESFVSAFLIKVKLRAGSEANLRPELFVKALAGQWSIRIDAVRLHRRALYAGNNGGMANPMDEAFLS